MQKLKILFNVISDFRGEEIVGTFYEKTLQKMNQKEFSAAKVLKRKGTNFYVKWKGYVNSFNSWIGKNDIEIQDQNNFKETVKVELNSSNFATKVDFKNAGAIYTSKFAKKFDLVSLKCNVDKLDIDKLKNEPTNLSNLKNKVDRFAADK